LAGAAAGSQYLSARSARSAAEEAASRNRQTGQLHDALGGFWQQNLLNNRQGQLDRENVADRDSYAALVARMGGTPDAARAAVAKDAAERQQAVGPKAEYANDEFGKVAGASYNRADRLGDLANQSADSAAAFSKMGRTDATEAAKSNLGDTLRGVVSRRGEEDWQREAQQQDAIMRLLMQITGNPVSGASTSADNLQLLGGLLNMGGQAAYGYGAMRPTGGGGGLADAPGLNPYGQSGNPIQ
jgi:hypothetical protein